MIIGCYDLRLMCDVEGCDAGEYGAVNELEIQAETGGECRRRARALAWRLEIATGEVQCPVCVKKRIRALVDEHGMEAAAKAMATSRSQLYRILGGAGGYRVKR